jgi:hypothetical protein
MVPFRHALIFQDDLRKSLLTSLFQREGFSLFGKEGLGRFYQTGQFNFEAVNTPSL